MRKLYNMYKMNENLKGGIVVNKEQRKIVKITKNLLEIERIICGEGFKTFYKMKKFVKRNKF